MLLGTLLRFGAMKCKMRTALPQSSRSTAHKKNGDSETYDLAVFGNGRAQNLVIREVND